MSAIIIFVIRIIAALSLYAFLGLMVTILWKDLFNKNNVLESFSESGIKINKTDTGETFNFKIPEIFIGRSDLAQIKLESDEAVSNLHARIFQQGKIWWIEDLQSTNGTLVNQDPIIVPIVLINGDRVTCGKTEFEINLDDESHSSEI